jgi:hypothetical protein
MTYFFDKGHCQSCTSIDNWNSQGYLDNGMLESLKKPSCDEDTVKSIFNECASRQNKKKLDKKH